MSLSPPPQSAPGRGSSRPDQSAIPMLPQVDHNNNAHPPPPGYNPLKVPASIIIRKDQNFKTAEKNAKSIHVITRADLTREMGTVNTIIGGINLIDSKARAVNAGLVFQVMGTHWVLELSTEVQKFAEEDIFLILFDVFYNAGYEMKLHYDQTIKSHQGMGSEIWRESWLWQRVRAQPTFAVNHP